MSEKQKAIRSRNVCRFLFRNTVKALAVALAELAAAGYVFLMEKDCCMVNMWQAGFIFTVGAVTAYMMWGE